MMIFAKGSGVKGVVTQTADGGYKVSGVRGTFTTKREANRIATDVRRFARTNRGSYTNAVLGGRARRG